MLPTGISNIAIKPVYYSPKRKRVEEIEMDGPVTNATIKAMLDDSTARVTMGFNKSIAELESRIDGKFKAQDEFNSKVWEKVDKVQDELGYMGNLLNKLDNRARRQNLIFTGIRSQPGENPNCVGLIVGFCQQMLGVDIQVNRAHRLRTGPESKPDVVANIPFDRDIKAIYGNVSKLKGTGHFIRKDLVGHIKRANETFGRFRKILLGCNVRVIVGLDFMTYDGYRFVMSNQNQLRCSGQDGCSILSSKLGFDVAPLWTQAVEGRRIGRKAGYHVEEQVVADMGAAGGSGVNSREFTVADYIRDSSATPTVMVENGVTS